MEFVWLFFALTAAEQCEPECRFECDDPRGPAVCDPVCQPMQCLRCINQTGTPVCQAVQGCVTLCPPDQCAFSQCPACEPQCPELCNVPDCFVNCTAPQCNWRCHKGTLRHPICAEVCEAPACEYSDASRHSATLLLGLLAVLLTTTS